MKTKFAFLSVAAATLNYVYGLSGLPNTINRTTTVIDKDAYSCAANELQITYRRLIQHLVA